MKSKLIEEERMEAQLRQSMPIVKAFFMLKENDPHAMMTLFPFLLNIFTERLSKDIDHLDDLPDKAIEKFLRVYKKSTDLMTEFGE